MTDNTPTQGALTPAHLDAIQEAINVIEGRWKASGAVITDWRAEASKLLHEVFAMAQRADQAVKDGILAVEEVAHFKSELEQVVAPLTESTATATPPTVPEPAPTTATDVAST